MMHFEHVGSLVKQRLFLRASPGLSLREAETLQRESRGQGKIQGLIGPGLNGYL